MDKIKKNFVICISDKEKISNVEDKILKYGQINFLQTGELYSAKYGVDIDNCIFDIIGFQFESDNQENLEDMLDDFREDLDELNLNYELKDFDTNEIIESIYFECREEMIVHFTSAKTFNQEILRKIHIIQNLSKKYNIPGEIKDLNKITIKNSSEKSCDFISITIKLYSLLDDDLKSLEKQVIDELKKLGEKFELEINHLD